MGGGFIPAGEKVVVAEEFTGTWSPFCPGAARGLKDLKEEFGDSIVVIAYHDDEFSTPGYLIRESYYEITSWPTVLFDGVERVEGGFSSGSMYEYYLPSFLSRLETPNPVDIDLESSPMGNGSIVSVTVENISDQLISGQMHLALIERHIPWVWQNMEELDFVCRRMLPDAYGVPVTLFPGQSIDYQLDYTIDPFWNAEECWIVAFFQGDDKEIYQGAEMIAVGGGCTPPTIVVPPQDDMVCTGDTWFLFVDAWGTEPLHFQWYQGESGDTSQPVGDDSDFFITPSLTTTTNYWVSITNECGQVDSDTATIEVFSHPEITQQPENQTISEGESATLHVVAEGDELYYQWYGGLSGNITDPIMYATSNTYTTPALTETTSYWVEVYNGCGETLSDTVTISVSTYCDPPEITSHPESCVVFPGQCPTLSVSATGTELNYQWFEGVSGNTSSPISGATESQFTPSGLSVSTNFWVRVSNDCGESHSLTATITIPSDGSDLWYAAHVISNAEWETWLHVKNYDVAMGDVVFFAVDSTGQYVDTYQTKNLASGASVALDLDMMFPDTKVLDDVWLMIYSKVNILGVTVFGTRDHQTQTTIPLYHSGAQELIFPYVCVSDEWFSGLTLVNTSDAAVPVTLEAFDVDGNTLSSIQISIEAYGKYVRLVEGVFTEVVNAGDIRFVRVISDGDLVGFELFGSYIDDGLAGLPVFSPHVDMLVVGGPRFRSAPATPTQFQGWGLSSSEIRLVWNAFSDTSVDHYNVYWNTDLTPVLLDSIESAEFTVSGLSAETDYEFSVTAVNSDDEESTPTPTIQIRTLSEGERDWPYRVFFNALPNPSKYFTGLTFSNFGTTEETVCLKLVDVDGGILAASEWVSGPMAQVTREAGSLFDGELPEDAAYVKAGSDSPFLGFELYMSTGVDDPYCFDGIAGLSLGARTIRFPLVKNSDNWYSSLRLTNLEPKENIVTIYAFDRTGWEVETWTGPIPSQGQINLPLSLIFLTKIWNITSLDVKADYPIIGDITYISNNSTRMSGYMGLITGD